jgi:hypothetical protein
MKRFLRAKKDFKKSHLEMEKNETYLGVNKHLN